MGYDLVLAFDTDDPEFCRGFEAADVDNAVAHFTQGDEPELMETVHATNAEMMLRIAERWGLRVRSEPLCNDPEFSGWLNVYFTRSE